MSENEKIKKNPKEISKSDDVLMREIMKQEMMEKISGKIDKDKEEFLKVLKTLLSSDDYTK